MKQFDTILKRRPRAGITKLDRAWQSMRIMRRFDVRDIVATAEIGHAWAARYINALVRSGHVRLISRVRRGHVGSSVYQLARDTGPLAPVLTAAGEVYDRNEATVSEPTGVRP